MTNKSGPAGRAASWLPADPGTVGRRRFLQALAVLGANSVVPGSVEKANAAAAADSSRWPPTRSAINVEPCAHWSNANPYLDLVRRTDAYRQVTGTATIRADGWLENIQPGFSCYLYSHLDVDRRFGSIPPGDYVATNTQGMSMQFQADSTNRVDSTTRATCTIPAVNWPPGLHQFAIRLTNNTGSVIPLFNTLQWFRAQDEGLINAGEIWRPEMQANLSTCAVIRTMTMVSPNWGDAWGKWTPDGHLATLSDRTFTERYNIGYDACARLARDLGKDLWVTFPYVGAGTFFEFDSRNNRVYPRREDGNTRFVHGYPEGAQVCWYHGQTTGTGVNDGQFYYVRNPDAYSFQLSETRGGAIVDILLDRGSHQPTTSPLYTWGKCSRVWPQADWESMFEKVAQQIRDNYSDTGRIYVELGNEPWNNGFGQTAFVRSVMSGLAGVPFTANVKTRAGHGNAWGSLLAWKAMLAKFPRTRLVFVLNGQCAWWDMMNEMFDYVDPGFVMPGKQVRRIVDEYAIANYTVPADLATREDLTYEQYIAADAQNQPDSWWYERVVKGGTPVRIEWTEKSIAGVRSKNPAIRTTTYECGQHVWLDRGSNYDATASALQQRNFAFWSGPAGAAAMQDYYQRCFVGQGLGLFAQFVDVGGWNSRRFVGGWGLKPHTDSPENARSLWFRAIPGTPTDIGTPLDSARVLIGGDSRSNLRSLPGIAGTREGGGGYTHLLIVGQQVILDDLRHNGSHRTLLAQLEAFMSRSPGAQPYLWTSSHLGHDGLTPATVHRFVNYERKMARVWDALTARINLTAANRGYSWKLRSAHAAYAVAVLVDRACNGTLPGITQESVKATIGAIFGDAGASQFTTPIGQYYENCLYIATVYRKSPVGMAHPAGTITAQQADSLQRIAWQALLEYESWYLWTPSMEDARNYILIDAGPTCVEHHGSDPGIDWFGGTTYASGNPFVFDAATDNTQAGWLAAP